MKRNTLIILLISFMLLGVILMTSCEPQPTPTPGETTGAPSTGAPTGEPTKETPKVSPTETAATGTPEATASKTPGEVTETPTEAPTEAGTPATDLLTPEQKPPAKPGKAVSGKAKVGILLVNEDIGDIVKNFKKLEKEGKVAVVFKKSGLDNAKQEEMAKEILGAGVNALILNPRDSMVGDKILKMAQKKNIPVFGVEIPISEEAVSQVGFYTPAAGVTAAKYIAEQIGNKGKIVVLSSDFDPQQQEMAKVLKESIEKMSGMEVTIVTVMGDKYKDSKKEIKKALEGNKDAAAFFAVNNDISVPAADMMNSMKMTDKVLVGYLGGFEAMKAINKYNFYKADVKNDIKDMGKETEKVVMTYVRDGKEVPRNVYLNFKIMDKESLKDVMPK